MAFANYFICGNNNRTNWNFTALGGGAGLFQGGIHVAFKRHGVFCPETQHFAKLLSLFGLAGYGEGMEKDIHKGDRIAKVIARAGLASRRDAERMIANRSELIQGDVILKEFTDDKIIIRFNGQGFRVGASTSNLFPMEGEIIIENYNIYDGRVIWVDLLK